MSNPFGDVKSEGLEETEDRLGGGFQTYETDAYDATLKLAYAGVAKSGAKNMTFEFDLGGKVYKETVYVTSKEGKNYFLNPSDNSKKVPLPGYALVNDLCLIITGKELDEQTFEEKVVKIYDFEQKKEIPTSVMVATELLGQPVTLGIVKQTVNKNKKVGDKYEPTAETRDENYIDKVFHPELKLTVVEARQGKKTAEEAAFYPAWVERNKGKTRDKRELKDGEAGKAGAPPKSGEAAGGTSTRKSLFG